MVKKKQIEMLRKLSVVLQQDMLIADLEFLEAKYKFMIRKLVAQFTGDASVAFEIARIQKKMGLLCKYKSYGVKACTPLGYAIFLLNPGEGFSFQNHLDFKIELFHILEVIDQGYVYISSQAKWNRIYDENKFRRWFVGEHFPEYNAGKIFVCPGDVIKINQTGIVHTAIGCVLEEFANVSTDMVERLFDQNKGKSIPSYFSRMSVYEKISQLDFPISMQEVSHTGNHKRKTIKFCKTKYGRVFSFQKSRELTAERHTIDAHRTMLLAGDGCYLSLFVTNGEGKLTIKNLSEKILIVAKGESVLLIPGVSWELENTLDFPLEFSFLAIHEKNALK